MTCTLFSTLWHHTKAYWSQLTKGIFRTRSAWNAYNVDRGYQDTGKLN